MADFILNRKISVDKYQFPEGAFKIYGSGKFYNGFAIGASNNLTVVNEDGVLKFSRGAAGEQEHTTVILGTIPQNNKQSIYVDVAVPWSQNIMMNVWFKINDSSIYIARWTEAKIYNTRGGSGDSNTNTLQAGGVLAIDFTTAPALPAIPNLCSVRAIWAL